MKNISAENIEEMSLTGRVVYDDNPDSSMYYFEFMSASGKKRLISYALITDALYFGVENKQLPDSLFPWLCENSHI